MLYKNHRQYLAYCGNTNEKKKLHEHIRDSNLTANRVLDLGCGIGENTVFLADHFAKIDAIDRSKSLLDFARENRNRKNINYQYVSFEDFQTQKYDFILMSHVLQYIDSDPKQFVKKAASCLSENGQLWIIQQTRQGMAKIIEHQKPFLNSKFRNWKTFEDYEKELKNDYRAKIDYLDTSIKRINFANPSEEDKLRLEFIFGIDNFDEQSSEFKEHLAKLNLGKRITHPNAILKIKR